MQTIIFNGQELRLCKSTYQNNDSLYVGLKDADGEFYADVTVNLPNSGTLPSNCAFVDTNNLSWEIVETLINDGIAKPINQSACSGFCRYYAYMFNTEDMEDYL